MANVLRRERQAAVIRLLAEGNGIRATERITGVHRDTICRLIVRFGNGCREFLDEELRGLSLRHVECDEIWTFVQKKQARLTTQERAESSEIGDMYVWTALDMDTKLVASYAIGKRSADMARRFIKDLAGRFETPRPHDSDAHNWSREGHQLILQLSTDGFAAYPEAVDLAFGPYVKYGQIIKIYRNARLQYDPSEMVGSDRRGVYKMRQDELRSICTSHVERHNLTIRTFLKRFNRLSLGFSKKLENLAAAVGIFMAYYNFCWRPRMPGNSGRKRLTPAMAAKVTGQLWTFDDLFNEVTARYL